MDNSHNDGHGRMGILSMLRNIIPYILPHRWLIVITLLLTLVTSLLAQVNAIVLDRTVVIISHNIGQIIDADMIYVLKEGRVVQGGTPKEVYAQGGVYKDIFDASARSMNVDKIAEVLGK